MLLRKQYVDELYDLIFVRGLKSISKLFDKVIDDKIIDDTIMRISTGFVNVGKRVATIQNANVRFYAVFMLLGMTFAFIYLYISLGL